MELVRKIKVSVDGGLHARPAAEIVRLSKTFTADVQIEANDQVAGTRSSLKLLMLSVKEGDEVLVRARGDDAETAVASITEYLSGSVALAHATEHPSPTVAVACATYGEAECARLNPPGAFRGIAVGGSRAVGPVFRFEQPRLDPEDASCPPDQAEANIRRALAAKDAVAARCLADAEGSTNTATREVLSALAEMVSDCDWSDAIVSRIRAGASALAAVRDTAKDIVQALTQAPDDYIRARAEDMQSAAELVMLEMQGKRPLRLSDAPAGAIILADELAAMHLGDADLTGFAGLVTAKGAANGHAAILARAAGLPAVFGLGDALQIIAKAQTLAIDGSTGEVFADPSESILSEFTLALHRQAEEAEALSFFKTVRPVTRDNAPITVAANIGSLADARRAVEVGAMGVGLFRTEFLFLDRPTLADEEEQFAVYRDVLQSFPEDHVIIRTLDIGGDKPARSIPVAPEDNPFLGLRGIRLCLARPDVFRVQLRALLRAAPFGNLKVMFPMISDISELLAARALLSRCAAELDIENIPYATFPTGVMIETPAAVFQSRELASVADFFSIGTNDLTQYVMAADRANPAVAHLCKSNNPAVIAALRQVCEAAREKAVPVGVCGEAAADPSMIPVLLAAGVTELSMSTGAILAAKRTVSQHGAA